MRIIIIPFMKKLICVSLALTLFNANAWANDELEAVTIIGTQEDLQSLPGSGAIIASDDLDMFEFSDVGKALSLVPGVYFRPEDGYGLRANIGIRGTIPNRSAKIALMEDGILIAPAPLSAPDAYYTPTFGRMSGIEVLKGPSALTEGPNTLGGAVNLISTPIPAENGGTLNLEMGQDGNRKLHAHYGGNSGALGFLVEVYDHNSDGYMEINGNPGRDSGFDKNDVVLKLSYQINDNSSLLLKYQDSDETSDQTYVGLADVDFARNPTSRYALTALDQMNNEHEGYNLTFRTERENMSFSATYFYNDYMRNWFKTDNIGASVTSAGVMTNITGAAGNSLQNVIDACNTAVAAACNVLNATTTGAALLKNNNRLYNSEGIDLKATFETGNHNITVGYRDMDDYESRYQLEDGYSVAIGGAMTKTFTDTATSISDNRRKDGKLEEYFITDAISLGNWTVTPGLRFTDYETTEVKWSDEQARAVVSSTSTKKGDASLFGIGATYDMANGTLYMGMHEGMTPTMGDAETADNYEIGYRNDNLDIAYFLSDYDNFVGTCTVSSGCPAGDGTPYNGGTAEISGIEISYSESFNEDGEVPMSMAINVTSQEAEFSGTFTSDYFGSITKGDNMKQIPEILVSIVNSATIRGTTYNTMVRHIGDTCSSSYGASGCSVEDRMDAYTVIDMSAERSFGDFDGYLKVGNLWDSDDNISLFYGKRAPRARYLDVGIRYDF
jgi:Fe(3+) dicitrate transport protein